MSLWFLRPPRPLADRVTTLEKKVETIMAIQQNLVAAVAAEKNTATAAILALQTLEGEVATLKAQAADGVDPAVLTQAIADLGTSSAALAAAIPANTAAPTDPGATAAPASGTTTGSAA